jgi:hypothetical protein
MLRVIKALSQRSNISVLRQRTSAYVSIRQYTLHTSAYVSIRQHTFDNANMLAYERYGAPRYLRGARMHICCRYAYACVAATRVHLCCRRSCVCVLVLSSYMRGARAV